MLYVCTTILDKLKFRLLITCTCLQPLYTIYSPYFCSLVVTFAAIKLQGPRLKPRPGQKFETKFLLQTHQCSASETTTSGTVYQSPSQAWKLTWKVSKWRSTDGCRYISREEETRMKFNGRWRRMNGKHRYIQWRAEGFGCPGPTRFLDVHPPTKKLFLRSNSCQKFLTTFF